MENSIGGPSARRASDASHAQRGGWGMVRHLVDCGCTHVRGTGLDAACASYLVESERERSEVMKLVPFARESRTEVK